MIDEIVNDYKIKNFKLKGDFNLNRKKNKFGGLNLEIVGNDPIILQQGRILETKGYRSIEIIKLVQDYYNFEALYENRYKFVLDNPYLEHLFYSNGRNSIWDNYKRRSGLFSVDSINSSKTVDEHFIPRLIISKIFYKIRNIRKIDFLEYVELFELLSKTIVLSKEEHNRITSFTRNTEIPGFLVYELENIEIVGLIEYIQNICDILLNKYGFDLCEFFNFEI
jgi:hypothetical protein